MGSGLSSLTYLEDKLDEDTVRELAHDLKIVPFDAEAFDLLADRNEDVNRDDLIQWTEPLTEDEAEYFREHLGCTSRLDFLKKFKPLVPESKVYDPTEKLRGATKAMVKASRMLRDHRVLPPWMKTWLQKRNFGTAFPTAHNQVHDRATTFTGVAVQEGWRPMTALGQACFEGHLEAAQWLYVHGCGPQAHDSNSFNGATPMWCAAQQGHLHCLKWLHDVDRHGSHFNHKSSSGSVAATLWAPNHRGITPLCAAAQMGHVAACDWLFRRARECEGGSVLQAQKQAVTAKAAAKVAVAHEAKGDAQAVHERWLAGQAILVTLEEHATVCIARARSQEAEAEDIAEDQKARAAVTAGKAHLNFLHEAKLQAQADAATAAARAEAEGALPTHAPPTLGHAAQDANSWSNRGPLQWRVPADFRAKDAADAAAALAVLASTVVDGGLDAPSTAPTPTTSAIAAATSDVVAPARESVHAGVASAAAKTTAQAAAGAAQASADTALGTAARLVALIRARDSMYHCSPLGWAVKGGHEATCVWLVQHGALHEGPSAVRRTAASAPGGGASPAANGGMMTPPASAGRSSSRPNSSSSSSGRASSAGLALGTVASRALGSAADAASHAASAVNPRRPWTTGPQPSLATAYQEHLIASAAETPPLEPSPLLRPGYTAAAAVRATATAGGGAGLSASRAGTAQREGSAPPSRRRSTLLLLQQQPQLPPQPQPVPGRELWGHIDPALVRRDLFPDPLQPLQPSQVANQQAKADACRRAILNDAKEACRRHAHWQSVLVAAVVLSQRAKTQPKARAAIVAHSKAQAEARTALEARIAKKAAKEARRERRASAAAAQAITTAPAEIAENADDQALKVEEESHNRHHHEKSHRRSDKSPDKERQASLSSSAKKPPTGRFSPQPETKVTKPYWLPPALYLLGGWDNSYSSTSSSGSGSGSSSSPDFCLRDHSSVSIWERIASFAGVSTGRRLRDAREVLSLVGRELAMHERGSASWKRPPAYGTNSYLLKGHHGGWRSDDEDSDEEGDDLSEAGDEHGLGDDSNLLAAEAVADAVIEENDSDEDDDGW